LTQTLPALPAVADLLPSHQTKGATDTLLSSQNEGTEVTDMPSPFPGMDPFLEGSPEWQDFHDDFIYAIRQALVPQVRPRYLVRAQTQVYVLEETDGHVGIIIPDVLVAEGEKPFAP
jgi:hypothetical protein